MGSEVLEGVALELSLSTTRRLDKMEDVVIPQDVLGYYCNRVAATMGLQGCDCLPLKKYINRTKLPKLRNTITNDEGHRLTRTIVGAVYVDLKLNPSLKRQIRPIYWSFEDEA